MSTEFTVILDSRHHVGDREGLFSRETPEARFIGPETEYAFSTPQADPGAPALLMLQCYGVNSRYNVIEINGAEPPLSGGLPRSSENDWYSHVLIVPSGKLLADMPNRLRIAARTLTGKDEGNLDDFMIGNLVILYRSRPV